MNFKQWWENWAKAYAERHGLQGFAVTENNAPTREQVWDAATEAERRRCIEIAQQYDENGMTLVRIEHPERYESAGGEQC